MDLLASLQLDSLPEQQTRAAHLGKRFAKDPDLRLGFNACCTCGKKGPSVECKGCCRVRYCSDECRVKDTQCSPTDEEEGAMGHSSIICSVLRLCQDDEDAEEQVGGTDAARDRVRSELESYPATMSNILREGPCYQELLQSVGTELVIHIVGASTDSELWNGQDNFVAAYGEALLQLAEDFRFDSIQLHMIGPECPEDPIREDRTMPYQQKNGSQYNLAFRTHQCSYSKEILGSIPKAHVVVFFNPGFTCPDYDWNETVACLEYGTALLLTTNTEMEGVSDCNFLLQEKLIPSLPPMVAEIMGSYEEGQGDDVFFSENPYAGSRVRQSGTMANDLYCKNRWMLASILAKPEKKRRVAYGEEDDDDVEEVYVKKPKGNTKKSNPALI